MFQIKKELFIFIFQIKSISKGTFWKKGTKWQSLVNSVFLLKFYTTGKNFTLPPAVTGVTNITSGMRDSIHFDRQSQRNRHFNHFSFNKHLELENVICCLLKLHSFLCQISIPSRCLKSFCHFPSRSCPIFLSGPGCVDWWDRNNTYKYYFCTM